MLNIINKKIFLLGFWGALVFALVLAANAKEGGGAMASGDEIKKQDTLTQCGLALNDEELKKILTPQQYEVTRKNGTELPFSNKYWDNKHSGIYVDIITGEPLFSSTEKFDSGTGWPSFIAPINRSDIVEKDDSSHGIVRREVRAKMSDSHLGHVFNDGPAPSGRRYCINSAALRFIPVEDLQKQGYGKYLYLFAKDKGKDTANISSAQKLQVAVFGAGCFWGVESVFRREKGVVATRVGYMGGKFENPTYEDVCTDKTGHAEVVRLEYDPTVVSYEHLLDLFWKIHDPTTKNRQGPDIGTQYRSVIFYYTPEQEAAARISKKKLEESHRFERKVVTEIIPAQEFYQAEDYHQQYFEKRGIKPTCHIP